jgi:hypothetical protein
VDRVVLDGQGKCWPPCMAEKRGLHVRINRAYYQLPPIPTMAAR